MKYNNLMYTNLELFYKAIIKICVIFSMILTFIMALFVCINDIFNIFYLVNLTIVFLLTVLIDLIDNSGLPSNY